MRKKPLFLFLVFILILLLSGCLPKVPEKITGPTWTSKYRLPLVKLAGEDKIYFNHEPDNEDGDNLGLKDVKTDLSYTYEDEQSFELIEEPPIVNLDIEELSIVIPDRMGVDKVFDVSEVEQESITFSLSGNEDLADYKSFTLSTGEANYNYIDFVLNGAKAAGDGFYITLTGSTEQRKKRLSAGETSARLDLSGLEINPATNLAINVAGKLEVTSTAISITAIPAPLKIGTVTISSGKFNDLAKDLQIEQVEETIELGRMADFELSFNTAALTITSDFPKNITVAAGLTIIAYNDDGGELATFEKKITLPKDNKLDLLDNDHNNNNNLNTILESKPHSLKFILAFAVGAVNDITISYPDDSTISLDYKMDVKFGHLAFEAEEGINTGEIEIPDDIPLNFTGGELFFAINNTSAASLRFDLWLSNDPSSFEEKNRFTAIIEPNKEKITSNKINNDHSKLFGNGKPLYYKIELTNLSEEASEFDEDDYLEISAWMDLNINVNPR